MTEILFTELRRSPALLAFPLLVALNLLVIWQDAGYWTGDWQATSIKAQAGTILLGPFLGGCAAWAAARGQRAGHELLIRTMPRPQLVQAAVQWGAVALWGLLAYTVGVVAAAVHTAPAADGGGPWPSFLVLGVLAVCAFSAVGYAAGSAVRWRYSAPVVGLLLFAGLALLGAAGWLTRAGLLWTDDLLGPGMRLRPTFLLAVAAWAVAVVLWSASVSATVRWPARMRIAAAILAAAPGAAVLLGAGVLGGGELKARAAVAEPVCEGNAPRVCVWPEHAKWAPLAASVAHRAAIALEGVARMPDTIYERGLSGAGGANVGEVRIDRIPVTGPALVAGLVEGIVPPRPPRCANDLGDRLAVHATIAAWIRMRAAGSVGNDIYVSDQRPLEALLRRRPADQARWVRRHLPAISHCDVPVSPHALDELS